jgi:hypothetical protein
MEGEAKGQKQRESVRRVEYEGRDKILKIDRETQRREEELPEERKIRGEMEGQWRRRNTRGNTEERHIL